MRQRNVEVSPKTFLKKYFSPLLGFSIRFVLSHPFNVEIHALSVVCTSFVLPTTSLDRPFSPPPPQPSFAKAPAQNKPKRGVPWNSRIAEQRNKARMKISRISAGYLE